MERIATLIQRMAGVRKEISATMGDEVEIDARPPAALNAIERAETKLGRKLPESYRKFLGFSNGYQGISFSYDLLGTAELISKDYADKVESIQHDCPKEEFPYMHSFILIGYGEESDTLVYIDPESGKVWWWSPDSSKECASFEDFLSEEIESLLKVKAYGEKLLAEQSEND
jgi:hypothetical protein